MSTYFYLECLSHDPTISSDDISQHDDIHVDNAIRMAQGLPIDSIYDDGYFEQNAASFLRAHPHCALDIVDEYDRHRPIIGRGPTRAARELRVARAEEARRRAREALDAAEAELNPAAFELSEEPA